MIHILIFYLPAKGFRWSGSINGRINLSLRDKSLNWKQKEKKKRCRRVFFFLICLSVIMYFVIFTIVFIILFSIFVLFAVCCLA